MRRAPIGVRVYGALLRALPAHFHAAFADEMLAVFAELAADGRRWPQVRALAAELPGLIRLVLRERRAERAARSHVSITTERNEDMLDSVSQDLRFAARSLRRSPGFAAIAVLTLGLGIGANTAIFSVVQRVLLTPLPVFQPERLVAVSETVKNAGPGNLSSTSPGSFLDWQRQTTRARLAGWSGSQGTLSGHGEPEVLNGVTSLGGLMQVLGVEPLFGRSLVVADEDPAAPRVIVLAYPVWQRVFGEDRAVLGKTLTLNGTARTIVGVMSPEFRFPGGRVDFIVPSRYDAAFRANRDQYFLQVIGRLEPGVTVEQLRADEQTVAARLERDWPIYNANLRIDVQPLQQSIVGGSRTQLLVLMGAVFFVLLITCANLGNLLLARASTRRREIAIRHALGAGRARVARQLLTESVALALAGGAAGIVIGQSFLKMLLAARATINLPRADEVALDGRVLLFTLVISLAAGAFFGSVPAWQFARARSSDALRDGTRGSAGNQWMRNVLVVSELALAMVLLTGAGLLLRSFALLQRVNPGVNADRVLTFTVNFRGDNPTFFPTTLDRIRALPGVRSAALVSQLPVTGRGGGAWFNRLDRPLPAGVKPSGEPYRVVTPEYFDVAGIPLRRGRQFTAADRREAPAVIVNEALVKKYYPGEDPIGKEVYLGAPDNRLFDHGAIVGVVADTRDAGLGSDALPTVFIPLAVMPTSSNFAYVVRTVGDPSAVAKPAREIIRSLDPTLPVRNIQSLDDVLSAAVAPARWSTMLLGTFAGVALVMAVLGVFGVLSFLVTQRTREIGIRVALGASSGSVQRMVVGRGLTLVALGVGLGLAGAFLLTRLMSTLLFGVTPTDPLTYAGVATVLIAAAAVASYLPSRRATRVDPIIALRAE